MYEGNGDFRLRCTARKHQNTTEEMVGRGPEAWVLKLGKGLGQTHRLGGYRQLEKAAAG